MTIENLINIVRLGKQLTPAQSRAIAAQLERIPAMERTLERKDHDSTELSIAYTAAIEAGKAKGVQAEEYERLKEAVRRMLDAQLERNIFSYVDARNLVKRLIK